MGEAKRRGTFEQRKAQAVERNSAEKKRREKKLENRKVISVGSGNRSSTLVAIAAAMSAIPHHPVIIDAKSINK